MEIEPDDESVNKPSTAEIMRVTALIKDVLEKKYPNATIDAVAAGLTAILCELIEQEPDLAPPTMACLDLAASGALTRMSEAGVDAGEDVMAAVRKGAN